jgi:hypothetical protein
MMAMEAATFPVSRGQREKQRAVDAELRGSTQQQGLGVRDQRPKSSWRPRPERSGWIETGFYADVQDFGSPPWRRFSP